MGGRAPTLFNGVLSIVRLQFRVALLLRIVGGTMDSMASIQLEL